MLQIMVGEIVAGKKNVYYMFVKDIKDPNAL